ncbi:MAG: VOC family protein [Nocardioidaceae bacterium]|nr:VOC family protein [Nocardioidaceae bacterium]
MTDEADTQKTPPSDAKPPVGVWPAFRYRDAKAAIEFLTTVLGFEESAVHTDGENTDLITHAELRWPLGGGIMLGSDRESPSWPSTAGQGATYVVTDDPDALHAKAVDAGVSVVQELTDQDYGSREFSIRDPEGNLWSFGTYVGT